MSASPAESQATPSAAEHAESLSAYLEAGTERARALPNRGPVRAGPDGLSIGELGARAGVTGSTLTHHMKLLAAAGLVQQVRKGRRIICIGAAYERMQALSEFLLNECCADAPDGGHGHALEMISFPLIEIRQ